jgi:hypothetical protein
MRTTPAISNTRVHRNAIDDRTWRPLPRNALQTNVLQTQRAAKRLPTTHPFYRTQETTRGPVGPLSVQLDFGVTVRAEHDHQARAFGLEKPEISDFPLSESLRPKLVAGAGFEPATFGL